MKFAILLCLVCSSGFLAFALWAEGGWLKTQKSALAVSSTPAALESVQRHFESLDENSRIIFFSDFLKHLGVRDRSISASIISSFEMTRAMTYVVFSFNGIAAFCVICLLVKKRTSGKETQPNKSRGRVKSPAASPPAA